MKTFLKTLLHILLVILLTILTQIGGLVYIIAILSFKKNAPRRKLKRLASFVVLYLLATFLIVPLLAPVFGRERIKDTQLVNAHSIFYKLLNRNYIKPELNGVLNNISIELSKHHPDLKLIYLDANFPFIDGFPLLPHLSHKDGKKIDVSLIYELPNNGITNKKPSISGYGVFAGPKKHEYDQIANCKKQGYRRYDFTKYLTLGKINKEIQFSKTGTKTLVKSIVNQLEIGKLFIEPHLKTRLGVKSKKIRFHGCIAVRHDDHIHFQLK